VVEGTLKKKKWLVSRITRRRGGRSGEGEEEGEDGEGGED